MKIRQINNECLAGGFSKAVDIITHELCLVTTSSLTSTNITSIRSSVNACMKQYKLLSKSKTRTEGKAKLQAYLDEDYKLSLKRGDT